MRRKFLCLALALTLFVGLVACGNKNNVESSSVTKEAGDYPDVVNIGVQTLITPELISRYDKIFEEYLGTRVELFQFDSGADVNRAFASGSIDIGAVGTSPAAIGISNDLGYEIIWYYDVIGSAESLAVKAESGIGSLSDVVGKKIATPFASTAHYSLLSALALEGVDPSDVELLDMQPDDIYAAWTRGDIDGAYVWNPVLGKLVADGGTIITGGDELSQKGVVTADLCAVNKQFADKYPNVVTGYIRAVIYGMDKLNDSEADGVKAIAEVAGISEDEAKEQMNGFIYPSANDQLGDAYLGSGDKKGALADTLKNTADFLKTQNSIENVPDKEAFMDSVTGKFIEEALKQ